MHTCKYKKFGQYEPKYTDSLTIIITIIITGKKSIEHLMLLNVAALLHES